MHKGKLQRQSGKLLLIGTAMISLGVTLSLTGCVDDPDCGICDPENLVLESISGNNYENSKVHLLSDGVSEGRYFIETIGPCEETEEALASPRGAEEYCKISPLLVSGDQGLEFVFNNLLEPTSLELVRKQPGNPNLFEVYDWKTKVLEVEGPITRFNGDYANGTGETRDKVLRSVNLSCIDNLAEMGEDFDHTVLDDNPDICEDLFTADGAVVPLKMDVDGTTKAFRGRTDWRSNSCDTPSEGPDTCCTVCDYELSVNIAKYGLNDGGNRRTPTNALGCNPDGDKYQECANFEAFVDRDAEEAYTPYRYDWNGETLVTRVPRFDRGRETHPDQRPDDFRGSIPCASNSDCAGPGLEGLECIGRDGNGNACDPDADGCEDPKCEAEWFVSCEPTPDPEDDTTNGYCVDSRFRDFGAGACYRTTEEVERCVEGECETFPAGSRLQICDANDNGGMTPEECCQEGLGGDTFCDPLFQTNVEPIARFDRNSQLPEQTRSCYCGDPGGQNELCAEQIEEFCTAPHGSLELPDGRSNEGEYITRFVTNFGGVIYDPAIKGFEYRPADLGNQDRALAETCAEARGNIGGLSYEDGWRHLDGSGRVETTEDFDRALCSGSQYTVKFNTDGGEMIRDKVGNDLVGKSEYTFETPEFHVVPGSGFPTDNLRIGACDDFAISFSNKYDLSDENTRKIELWQLAFNGNVEGCDVDDPGDNFRAECWTRGEGTKYEAFKIAGGLDCVETLEEVTEDDVPCLVTDVSEAFSTGKLGVFVDQVTFGKRLFERDDDDQFGRETSGRYRLVAPGLRNGNNYYASLEEAAEDLSGDELRDVYQAAFHDACGMPLITDAGYSSDFDSSNPVRDFHYDFSIDEPKCSEDEDGDNVELSCDNGKKTFNPDQQDADRDGIGDVEDLCVTVVDISGNNLADADRDGVGNDCDLCFKQLSSYNGLADDLAIDAYMWVFNSPIQSDFDQDGVGDQCDNCVAEPNCEGYGPGTPYELGDPIDTDNDITCQTDDNADMIGDACAGDEADTADGPVGLGAMDDFDQDGINNLNDFCPRQPVSGTVCADSDECGADEACYIPDGDATGVCNHADADGDSVGNVCDTCPFSANMDQILPGGLDADDEDGDFVGNACETNSQCFNRPDPRPYSFHEVAVDGQCCVTTYPGDGEYFDKEDGTLGCRCANELAGATCCDPDGLPIRVECDNEPLPEDVDPQLGTQCRGLPNAVKELPGVVELPPGCEQALADAGISEEENPRQSLADFGGDLNAMWDNMCFLPPRDQDFDGVGDACDFCTYAYDPFNELYVDTNGKVWPGNFGGKFCSGVYDIENVCSEDDPGGETDGETGEETAGETGEEETG